MRRAAGFAVLASVFAGAAGGCGENVAATGGAAGASIGSAGTKGAAAGMAGTTGASSSGTSGAAGAGVGGTAGVAVTGGSAGAGEAAGAGGSSTAGGRAGAPSMAGSTNGAGTSSAGFSVGGAGTSGESGGTAGAGGEPTGPLSVLVFSKTAGFRHDSIPAGTLALQTLAEQHAWSLTATEAATVFTTTTLATVDVIVFLSTTGDVLDDTQQAAFEAFIRAGGGFVGIHSATDTEYDWAFYGELVGAYFREHPAIQEASVHVEDTASPIMAGLPAPWTRTDEWYAFKSNPRPNVHVLMTLDESSYDAGTSNMGGDHPISWLHDYEGGRAFYTALGHTQESYADPLFTGMLGRAVEWAGRRGP